MRRRRWRLLRGLLELDKVFKEFVFIISMGAVIRAIGTYFPERILTNQELERILAASGEETNDDWIVQRTGIRKRRIAAESETVGTMAVEAAKDAIKRIGTDIPPIEHIILATNTSERNIPNSSSFVQAEVRRGHPKGIDEKASFQDVIAGCGGINFALFQADAFIRSDFYKTILVIGSDKLSSVNDYSDRRICVLFGDGASAYVLSGTDDKAGFMGHYARGNGLQRGLIENREEEKVTFAEAVRAVDEGRRPAKIRGHKINLDGQAVFKYVGREWEHIIEGFRDNKGLNPEGVDFEQVNWASPHLANLRNFQLIEGKHPGFLKKCGLDNEDDIIDFCNTSTASQGSRSRQFLESANSGEYLLMFGYGAGLNSCANLYKQAG